MCCFGVKCDVVLFFEVFVGRIIRHRRVIGYAGSTSDVVTRTRPALDWTHLVNILLGLYSEFSAGEMGHLITVAT